MNRGSRGATRMKFDIVRQNFSRCTTRKFWYPTRADALTAAEESMTLGKVELGCHLTPYLCTVCHYWHIYNRRIVFPVEES